VENKQQKSNSKCCGETNTTKEMKIKNTVLSLLTVCILAACSASPAPEFMKAELKVALPDIGVVPAEMTVEKMVGSFSIPGKWSKLSATEWMLTMESEDKVTKKQSKMQWVYETQPQLNGAVLVKRLVVDGEDAGWKDIVKILAAMKQK
jgi:hypothetical protein